MTHPIDERSQDVRLPAIVQMPLVRRELDRAVERVREDAPENNESRWAKVCLTNLAKAREHLIDGDLAEVIAVARMHLSLAVDSGDWDAEFDPAVTKCMYGLWVLLSVCEARAILQCGRFEEVATTMEQQRRRWQRPVPPSDVRNQVEALLAELEGEFDESGHVDSETEERYCAAIRELCKPHSRFWRQLLPRLSGVSPYLK